MLHFLSLTGTAAVALFLGAERVEEEVQADSLNELKGPDSRVLAVLHHIVELLVADFVVLNLGYALHDLREHDSEAVEAGQVQDGELAHFGVGEEHLESVRVQLACFGSLEDLDERVVALLLTVLDSEELGLLLHQLGESLHLLGVSLAQENRLRSDDVFESQDLLLSLLGDGRVLEHQVAVLQVLQVGRVADSRADLKKPLLGNQALR